MAFISKVVEKTITRTLKLPYLLYLPQDYANEQDLKWPVVIFLHGAGERGPDFSLLCKHGLPRQVHEGREFPFIIVAPLCSVDDTWDRNLDGLDCLLEEIITAHPVDTQRIYLTGLSMGGFGTWHWATRHPQAFATLVPICGGTWPLLGFPEKIATLKNVPIWVFHGADDEGVPVHYSEQLVDLLKNLDAPVRFTKYPGVGHNSWDLAYGEPELIPWLLEQKNTNFHFCCATSLA